MKNEYSEQRLARERKAERRELAHAMAALFHASRDEDDFVRLWLAISGREEEEARQLYFNMLPWTINKVRTIIFSFEKTKKTFSVNDLIALIPEEHQHLAGKAIMSLRARLEPVGWTIADSPARRRSGVRTWRFPCDGE